MLGNRFTEKKHTANSAFSVIIELVLDEAQD